MLLSVAGISIIKYAEATTKAMTRTLFDSPSAVELQGALKWKDCLVGHFVDKKIPFLAVRSVAFRKWADYGLVEVLSNEKGFYFFEFGSADICRQIVEIGPWHFGGRLMVLQLWHSDIEYEREGQSKLPIWIQLYNVPLQFWTAEGLSYIASSVGKPLYEDEMTETAKRISYAKICVEVDVTASLPHSVDLFTASGKMVTIAIKYPWRPVKCGSCKVFGHFDWSQKVVQTPAGVTDPTKAAPKDQVWVVKTGGGDSFPNPLEASVPAVIVQSPLLRNSHVLINLMPYS